MMSIKKLTTLSLLTICTTPLFAKKNELGLKADYGIAMNTYSWGKSGSPSFNINELAFTLGGYYERKILGPLSMNVGFDFTRVDDCTISYPFSGSVLLDDDLYSYQAYKVPVNISLSLARIMYLSAGVTYHYDVSTMNNRMPFPSESFTGFGYQFEAGFQARLLNTVRLRISLFAELNNSFSTNSSADPNSQGKILYFGLRGRTGLLF